MSRSPKATPFTPVSLRVPQCWPTRSGLRTLAHRWIITRRIITLDFTTTAGFELWSIGSLASNTSCLPSITWTLSSTLLALRHYPPAQSSLSIWCNHHCLTIFDLNIPPSLDQQQQAPLSPIPTGQATDHPCPQSHQMLSIMMVLIIHIILVTWVVTLLLGFPFNMSINL